MRQSQSRTPRTTTTTTTTGTVATAMMTSRGVLLLQKSNCVLAVAAAVLVVVVVAATGVRGDTKSRVLVHIPSQLSNNNNNNNNATGYPHVQATFGFGAVPPAARSLAEYVYFLPAESLCRPLQNRTAGHPAHPQGLVSPFMLLINNNNNACSAVTKARFAQQAGAAALLLADSGEDAPDPSDKNDGNKRNFPVLFDDGSGSDVSIPTFLIFKTLAEKLKEQTRKNQACLVELQWGIPDDAIETEIPQFEFWTSAYDPLASLEFYEGLRTVSRAFRGHAQFAPRYKVVSGQRFRCNTQPDANAPCDHLCSNHGRYCQVHARNLSGHSLVRESLRRLCIWEHYGGGGGEDNKKKDDDEDKFWDYAIYHKQFCQADQGENDGPTDFANPNCLESAYKAAGIDADLIGTCTTDSGGLDDDVSNSFLDSALAGYQQSGVHALPAITVNRRALHWATPRSLFDTLCTEFWLSGAKQIPQPCQACASCPNAIACLEKGGKCVEFDNAQRHPDTGFHPPAPSPTDHGKGKKGGGSGWKVFWFLAFVAACGGAYRYYDRNRDRFVRRGGGGLMNDYMNIPGGEFQ